MLNSYDLVTKNYADYDGHLFDKPGVHYFVADGRSVLSEPEAKAVLAAYGIPVVMTLTARDPAQAAAVARTIPGPVALKILSPDITHKSDVGGVRLDLRTPDKKRNRVADPIHTTHGVQ